MWLSETCHSACIKAQAEGVLALAYQQLVQRLHQLGSAQLPDSGFISQFSEQVQTS
tara:strand:- start:47 stop:214 length:168 start_codon:yes stop_codon:yes gene_type:complete